MQQLVDRILQGEQAACKELYHLFAVPMYNICLRITNDANEANDVLQEVFVKVFQNLKNVDQVQLLPAWIKRITVNTALQNIQRSKKMKLDESIDPVNLSDIEFGEGNSVSDIEDEHELLIANIQEAITQLPDRYRIVFTLHVIEDYSHEEIAKMLGIVSSTSRRQYLRAKVKLVEILKKNKSHVRPIEKVYTTA